MTADLTLSGWCVVAPRGARRVLRMIVGCFATTFAVACTSVPISYYDATTYAQLTGLKAETTTLVESFDSKPVAQNEGKIETVTLSFRKAHEYEKGKGAPNSDTSTQFQKIWDLYMQTIQEYRDNGPKALGVSYFREASVVLGQAFDIAIATENLKNRDKR